MGFGNHLVAAAGIRSLLFDVKCAARVQLNHEGHKGHEEIEAVARLIVDAGLKVHRALGPGLLESAYEHCLAHELHRRGLRVERQLALPIVYEGTKLDIGYRLDLMVADSIIVEIKAVDSLMPIHEAQLMTYLRLSGRRLGFLINFNVALFKHGLRRFML